MNTLKTELEPYKHHFSHMFAREDQQGDSHMGTDEKAKRLTIHDKQLILDRYKDGLNGTEIAQTLDLSYSAVIYYLSKVKKRNGMKKAEKELAKAARQTEPRSQIQPDVVESMVDMWNSGVHNYRAIAEKHGVADVTAAKYLKQRGCFLEGQVKKHTPTYTPKYKRTPVKHETKASSNMMDELKREIMQEIKHDLKEAMIRELLGK